MGNNTHFGAGQYVAVGVNTADGMALGVPAGNAVKTITGDTSIGTQFITTDPDYPGLTTQMQGLPAQLSPGGSISELLRQGHIEFKGGSSTSIQLSGLNKGTLPSGVGLNDYAGDLIWQDRRNSTLILNDDGTINTSAANGGRPCYPSGCNGVPSALGDRGVTETSPGMIWDSSAQMTLVGTIYQPRGAWLDCQGGGNFTSAVSIITGMVHQQGSCSLTLLPNSTLLINYIVALIH
jgi:hypothetical protein